MAGASGAVGRPLVPRLIAAGHEVTGMTRSEARAAAMRAAGAEAAVVDVYDAPALDAAMAAAAPEVVVHELTALPPRFKPRKKDIYDATNRLRTEGTRNLLAAARAAGAQRFVCQSIAFAYAPQPGRVHEEDDPLFLDAPAPFSGGVRALAAMEEAVLGADALEGWCCATAGSTGPAPTTARAAARPRTCARRRLPVVGERRRGVLVHPRRRRRGATVAAVDHGAPGIYNVVDDEPAPMPSGCRPTPRRSAPSRRGGCRCGWRAWSPAASWRR